MGYRCKKCRRMFALLGQELRFFLAQKGSNVIFCPYCGQVYLNKKELDEVHLVAK